MYFTDWTSDTFSRFGENRFMARPAKPLESLPNRARAVRLARKLSPEAVAECMGVTVTSIYRYETDPTRLTVYDLERLAKCLGTPAADLLNSTNLKFAEDERRILEIFRRLSDTERSQLVKMAAALISDEQHSPRHVA